MKKNIFKTLDFDYIKCVSNAEHLNLDNESHVNLVRDVLEKKGFREYKVREGYMWSSPIGIRVFFGISQAQRKLYLETDFSGKFFISDDGWNDARKFVKELYQENALIPKISRVDVRIDLKSKNKHCSNPFNTFPKIDNPKAVRMVCRGVGDEEGEASYNLAKYFNDKDLTKLTGFRISRSKWKLISYSRLLNLEKKKTDGKIDLDYYNHYQQAYKGYGAVQRVELTLRDHQTRLCNILFFSEEEQYKSKSKCAKKILSHFGKNHTIYEKKEGEWKESENFKELFYISEYQTIKEIQEESANISINSLVSAKGNKRDSDFYLKALAKKMVEENKHTRDFDFYVINSLKDYIAEVETEVMKKESDFLKTIQYFGYGTEDNLNAIRASIISRKQNSIRLSKEVDEASIQLNRNIEYEESLMAM